VCVVKHNEDVLGGGVYFHATDFESRFYCHLKSKGGDISPASCWWAVAREKGPRSVLVCVLGLLTRL
jgi:hypothetical protein